MQSTSPWVGSWWTRRRTRRRGRRRSREFSWRRSVWRRMGSWAKISGVKFWPRPASGSHRELFSLLMIIIEFFCVCLPQSASPLHLLWLFWNLHLFNKPLKKKVLNKRKKITKFHSTFILNRYEIRSMRFVGEREIFLKLFLKHNTKAVFTSKLNNKFLQRRDWANVRE